MSSVTNLGNFVQLHEAVTATTTALATGGLVKVNQYLGALEIFQSVGTVSGTTPTLNGKIQECVDSVGFGLSNATYDHTGGTYERMLTSTGDFASYTFAAGDHISISGAAGIPAGLYEIASREDDDIITLEVHASLTADSTSDVDSASPTDVTGATFTEVTESDATESIVVAVDSTEKWIRYVGTIAGTTPSFALAVIGFGQQKSSA